MSDIKNINKENLEKVTGGSSISLLADVPETEAPEFKELPELFISVPRNLGSVAKVGGDNERIFR